jgi:hypothetical protein
MARNEQPMVEPEQPRDATAVLPAVPHALPRRRDRGLAAGTIADAAD